MIKLSLTQKASLLNYHSPAITVRYKEMGTRTGKIIMKPWNICRVD